MYIQRGVEATRISTRDYVKTLPTNINTDVDMIGSSLIKNGSRRIVTTLN